VFQVRGVVAGDHLVVGFDGRRLPANLTPARNGGNLVDWPGRWTEELVAPAGKTLAEASVTVPRATLPADTRAPTLGTMSPVGLRPLDHVGVEITGDYHVSTGDLVFATLTPTWVAPVPHPALPAGLSLRLTHDGHLVWNRKASIAGGAAYRPVNVSRPGTWTLSWVHDGRVVATSSAVIPVAN